MIRLELPWVPISSNRAYFNLRTGGRMLSKDGKKFKAESSAHLAQKYPQQLVFFKPDVPYVVMMRYFFEAVENKKGAKERFKRIDVDNRTKLLQDVLSEVGGFNDAQIMTAIGDKRQGFPERTVVWAWNLEEEVAPEENP